MVVASVSDWVGAIATAMAVFVAVFVYWGQQRSQRKENRERLEEADRAAVGGISAWLEFRRGAPRLAIGNYTDDAIFDWTARVVPSGHMQVAASISVLDHDAGPLRPRRVLRVALDADDGTAQARVGGPRVQVGSCVETNRPARYVALRFVDSVGREWLRANAQLTRLADRQGLWDFLAHVHNFRLAHAAPISEPDWQCVLAAAGPATTLPRSLREVADRRKHGTEWEWCTHPFWVEQAEAQMIAEQLAALPAAGRPRRHTTQHPRRSEVVQTLDVDDAVRKVTRFFRVVGTTTHGIGLFLRGD